MQKFLGKLN
jgi:hypothetical protein